MKKWVLSGSVLAFVLMVGCSGQVGSTPAAQQTPPSAQQVASQPPENKTVPKEQVHEQPAPQEKPKPQIESGTVVGQVYFSFDKYDIRADMESIIDQAAQKIKESQMKVLLGGNTDEFGSGEYNFALANKRALSVKQALIIKGIAQDTIRVVSLGETKPSCQEKNKTCYRKNRRVDIKVVEE
ncbi:OmpA family protein [Helicobacter suis]|uniref:OmpA family protein n=1 Tax=Helicobacter suis TaxID=104628 RepID=UPI000CF127FD|nr:OmpA family protein [Helicobacter suis]